MTIPEIASLYVHFPFCRKVCPFCSFAVLKDQPEKHARYVALLARELELLAREEAMDFSGTKTLYVGGGTPSRLSLWGMESLVRRLSTLIPFHNYAQVSVELNPEDIEKPYIHGLGQLGFNRFSLGIQSFQQRHLETLRRAHGERDVLNALSIMQTEDDHELNIDLMFGYPGQTMSSLERDLRLAVDNQPDHISVYALTLEEKTTLYRNRDWRRWLDENERLVAEMYRLVVVFLTSNGYEQYEISNFSKPGKRSLYNLSTWNGKNYLGLGAGAHSYLSPIRRSNHRRWKEYNQSLNSAKLPRHQSETLNRNQFVDEAILLGLRQTQGIDVKQLSLKYDIKFSDSWNQKLGDLIQNNLARFENHRLRLTLEGMLLCDEITGSLAATL